ncbi:MAG: dihydroorotate dehydrogenase-like protein [Pirellulaceae bacterium]|nr:dihydroorotate dehydrogenase-like protein [Pirellulaceae bacterium]
MPIDISTHYLGLQLDSPLIVSACPLTGTPDSLSAIQEAGGAAAVLPSLFEEQIEHYELETARLHDYQTDSMAESLSFFPEMNSYNTGPEKYLDLIRNAKKATSIPIIASLNGFTRGGWLYYARLIEQAGADAIELNIYDIPRKSSERSTDVELQYCELVAALKHRLTIPLAIKIGPYFSSIPSIAKSLTEAGADGLVLFNRYLAPDIDLDSLQFKPVLELSRPAELRLTLRWIAILRDQIAASLAATGGVHQSEDVVKSLLVGADVTMLASSLIQNGIEHLRSLKAELLVWLERHQYESVQQLKGSMSYEHCSNPDGLLRANYLRALTCYTNQLRT